MLTAWGPLRALLLLTLSPATSLVFGFHFHMPKFGRCPNVAAKQNFISNIDPFLGKWYVQSSYKTEVLQGNGRCMAANYKFIPLNNAVLVQTGQFNEDNESWERLDADAYPMDVASDEGKFNVKFTVPYWGEMDGSYAVLDTDNENYSVVHGCGAIFKFLHYECCWLMSRKQRLTPEEEEEFYKNTDEVLKNYDTLDVQEFKKVDQVNCEREAI